FAKNWYRTRTEAELGDIAPEPELFTYLNHHMLYQDPPDHTRLRALISSAFRPKMVRDLAPRIQAIADELDITRDTRAHLAFGMGIHYCVGAPLARLEGRIAFQTLLARLPNLRLAGAAAELEWRPAVLVYGLERLPVAWDVDVVGL
ncbi:MAG: hypothetical protein P8Y45_23885, partial [Exilibacterium sp.]